MQQENVDKNGITDEMFEMENKEYTEKWKDSIFLPFDLTWETLIVVSVFIETVMVLTGFFFAHEILSINHSLIYGYYLLEGLYFIDTVLSIRHR